MGQLSCLDDLKNLGFSACKKLPRQVKGMITTPKGFTLTIADAGSAAAWQAAILAEPTARIYYWPTAVLVENINEEAVYEENSLSTIFVRDGRYKWRISFQENLNYHKDMYSHKNFQGRVFLIDDANQIIGTSLDDVNIQGFSIDLLNPEKLFFNDGSAGSKTPVYVSLADNTELDKFGCMVQADFLNTLVRLTTVDLTVNALPAPIATGFDVTIVSSLDNSPILGLVLADFVLLDAVGVAQTITVLTDNGDGTYTITGVGLVTGTIDLVDADALSIEGYESDAPADVTI